MAFFTGPDSCKNPKETIDEFSCLSYCNSIYKNCFNFRPSELGLLINPSTSTVSGSYYYEPGRCCCASVPWYESCPDDYMRALIKCKYL